MGPLSAGLIAIIVLWVLAVIGLICQTLFVYRQVDQIVRQQNDDDGDDDSNTKKGFGKKCFSYFFGGVLIPYILMHLSLYFLTDIDAYDPRTRPWYVKAAGEPKDMVIIIDSSGSMLEKDRMKYAKAAAKKVLTTLNDNDRVAVISFATEVHYPGVEFITDIEDAKGTDYEFNELEIRQLLERQEK